MSKTVQPAMYDILRTHNKFQGDRLTGDYGVEIETETHDQYDYPTCKYWRCDRDNSLREWGVEYILKAPMNRLELGKALEEFAACDKKFKFNRDSISTSVHVHMNILNENILTVANILTLYALFENILIKFSGPDRLSNLFCLPMRDCEGVAVNIRNMLTAVARNNFRGLQVAVDNAKYGAINIATVARLGTLEFRSFRGEVDVSIIERWVGVLDKMKTYAKRPGVTPTTIMNSVERMGTESLAREVFGQYSAELGLPATASLVDVKSLYFGGMISSSAKDWSKFGIIKVKPVYKEKLKEELDNISLDRFKVKFDELDFGHRMYIQEEHLRANPYIRVIEMKEDL